MSTACLGGDKIAGQWIGRTSYIGGPPNTNDTIMVCNIQKNGDSYVVDYHYLRPGKDDWTVLEGQKGLGATLNGNLISVLTNGVTLNMTYIEKDETIKAPPMGLNWEAVVLERDDDNKKIEALKAEIIKGKQKK